MSTRLDNPRTEDWLRRRAGEGLDMACDGNNGRLARALGTDPSDTSRWRNARRPGPHSRFFTDVYRMAANPRTNAWALLAEAHAAAEAGLMAMTDEQAVRRWRELMQHEAEREGAENGLSQTLAYVPSDKEAVRAALLALAGALVSEAGVELELAAMCRELARRDIDPREEL